MGLGREAIVAGYTVLFTGAMELVANLAKAQVDGRLEERLTHFAKPKLLIVDELGYLPLEPDAAHLFFQLVSRRYERGSTLITSNRAVGEATLRQDPFAGHLFIFRGRRGDLVKVIWWVSHGRATGSSGHGASREPACS